MWYWNKSNFEGLDAIAAEAGKLPVLKDFGRYCQLRSSGFRKQALAALHVFLTHARSLAFQDRKGVVCWLLEAKLRAPSVHQLLPHPLVKELVEPTLDEWIRLCPEESAAHRWRGCFLHDETDLRKAVEIDETDAIARRCLMTIIMDDVEYATHHLGEGVFLGDEAESVAKMTEVKNHLGKLPDGPQREGLQSWLAEMQQLVFDWIDYKDNPEGSFSEWCSRRMRTHQWPTIVYYAK